MKDPAESITNIYAGLLGGLTYGGQAVPFFTSEPWQTVPDYFVTLQNIEMSPENDDARFRSVATVTLDIVTKMTGQNTRTQANAIATQILQALLPGTGHQDGDFDVWIREASSPGFLHSQKGPVNINRKILNIDNYITEKT